MKQLKLIYQTKPPNSMKNDKKKISAEKNAINKVLGMNVCNLRKQTGLTQEQVADALGVTRVTVVNIEKGKQAITIHSAVFLCFILKCKLSDFVPMKSALRKEIEKMGQRKVELDAVQKEQAELKKKWDKLQKQKNKLLNNKTITI